MSAAPLGRVRFLAMGTTVEVHALAVDLAKASVEVQRLFRAWEATLTRFRPDSEISALNRSAGRAFVVSDLLFRVVSTALHWAQATQGTFDPTLLHQIERLGYRRTFSDIEHGEPLAPLDAPIEPGGQWRSVRIEPSTRMVTLPLGTALDLGGVAKGMAVDAALEALRGAGVRTALVNAGGDLAVSGLPPDRDAWPVAVAELPDEVIPLQRGAIATSGVQRRRWKQGDVERHHLLDPQTGYPVKTGLQFVTVVAATCTEADVAATTAFLLGAKAGSDYLRARKLAGLFVPVDGTPIRVGSWPTKAR
ncbi:MAG: FAD:protein FMN transferase [Thermaerobacter sp.]|nr:FAD:protein FMN transferase [Thermaerobacter sp.]